MINWLYYPKSGKAPPIADRVIVAFEAVAPQIESETQTLSSNAVLASVAPRLLQVGFQVETGKTADAKIQVPVLFGLNGRLEKSFDADAYHRDAGFVLEIEAGRGVTNNQFLKDLFQACMMHDVYYLGIAVRNVYKGRSDFAAVIRFFDTMYASNRLELPLKGILVIGY